MSPTHPQSVAAAEMIGAVAADNWLVIVAVAILLISASGICSLIYSAQSVHRRDNGSVVNFERHPPRLVKR